MNKQIINKLNQLYVLYRKKFLILNESGYKTIQTSKEKKINLTDIHLRQHLHQKQTIGVFSGTIFSKFICFDVDIIDIQLAKMTVYKLVNTLQEMNIPDEYINISLSGSKGYHVEIFFDKPVQNTLIKQFYLMALNYSGLLNLEYGKVELRPTDTQGVKIPLGKHFKTGNICWFCDYANSLNPIENYDHILSIKQLESEYFYDLMSRQQDCIELDEKQAEEYENVVNSHNQLKIYSENIDESATVEAIEGLIKNGLSMTGTRHNSIVKIAKYNKFMGMSECENKTFLTMWMSQQDTRLYTASYDEYIKDINNVVEWVYVNNCSIVIKNINISITAEEIKEILKIKDRNEKVILYALLIHKKRYGLKSGTFYMTHQQMVEATGLSKRGIINIINRLETNNIIIVTRSDTKKYNKILNKVTTETNIYKLNLLGANYGISENQFKVCDKNCKNCFSACLCCLFNENQLKEMLTKDHYYKIINFKKSDFLELPCVANK